MSNFQKKIIYITQGAMIAALYVVLTCFINAFGLASNAIQIRISEAMTILPAFTPAAIPGLYAGCIISNIATGCIPPDVILGSIATLIGAVGTYLLRKRHRFLASVPPIVANTLIVPITLKFFYHAEGTIPFFMITIGIGEVISCGILGQLLYAAILPVKKVFHPECM